MNAHNPRRNIGVSWGIPCLDEATQGLTPLSSSIVETPDHLSGLIILAKFLTSNRDQSKRALVTLDNPDSIVENLRPWRTDLTQLIEEEQLYIIQLKPEMLTEIVRNKLYLNLFRDIATICGGELPRKIALHQIDAYLHLDAKEYTIEVVREFSAAVSKIIAGRATFLSQFQNYGDIPHQRLAIDLEKLFPSYYQCVYTDPLNPVHYRFIPKKLQSFGSQFRTTTIQLDRYQGFIPVIATSSPTSKRGVA